MDSLILGPGGAKRPAFRFEGQYLLSSPTIPAGQLSLSGPSQKLDAAHWPVRGDLAHIRLAGKCFVPHYAVPMPRVVAADGTALRSGNAQDSETLTELAAGTLFNVLDFVGNWAWGQVGEDGLVGYLESDALGDA